MDKNNERKTNGKPKKKLFKFLHLKKVDKSIVNNASGPIAEGKDTATQKGKKKNKKTGWKVFKICLFVFLALVIIGIGVTFGVVSGIIDKTDNVALDQLENQKLTTFVKDKDGNEIAALFDTENRVRTEFKDIPKSVYDAILSIEDERFETHGGVDIQRTLAAVFSYVISGGNSDFGGSTLTQQLVKQVTGDKEGDWTRKIREWYRAIELESKLDKDKIFEAYANTVYLGDGVYGVEMASRNYFAKSVKDVNIAESAVLAALIQTPGEYNPYAGDESKQRLVERQKIVLNQMLKLGKITQEQYDEATKFELKFERDKKQYTDVINSYFVDEVIEQVIDDLMEQKNVTEVMAEQMLYTNGYTIQTTMDSNVQKAVDEAYNNDKLFYTDKDGKFMQSSMVVMDQSNGNVVGLMGGAGKKTGNRVWNWATSELNQPGSTMKPLGAYGPAFEFGVSYPAMGVDDVQTTFSPGYTPGNYYPGYNGYVTAREAIAKSMNIPALKTAQKVGVDASYNFATSCGLSLVKEDKNLPSLALGGLTYGVSTLEMAGAYSTIANGGTYMTPKFYTKVLDKDGNEVLVKSSSAKKVMKDTTAYLLTDCLRGVTTGGGTASGYIKLGNMPVAGKTGNTNDDYDQWFIGYTPYYTIACWNGYKAEDKKAIGYRTGIKGTYPYTSIVLFNTVMGAIVKDKEVKQFDKPAGIVTASVCRVSGLVATDACKRDPRGDRTITDIFASGTVPTKTCDIHKLAKIDPLNGLLANEDTLNPVEKSFITRSYVPNVKPNDWQYMLPTQVSPIHPEKKPPVVEEPEKPDDEVDPYGNKVVKKN